MQMDEPTSASASKPAKSTVRRPVRAAVETAAGDTVKPAAQGEAKDAAGRQPGKEPLPFTAYNVEALSRNLARLIEEGGKTLAAYMRPREQGKIKSELPEDVAEAARSIGKVAEYWLSDPKRAMELQTSLGRAYLELWGHAVKRMAGEDSTAVTGPEAKDKRFADPEWSQNQFFNFLKQVYLLTTHWAEHLVQDAAGVDEHTRKKAAFYIRQISNAIAPSNFVLTNPELLRETLSSNAENLVRGMHMLAEDIEAGHGQIKLRQSDPTSFEVGVNLAVTPGKVVFQNELMQLIQYEATTPEVLKVPLLIVPPWINKFYILDLTPEKSFIKWCVDSGVTVFVISWVNPDARLAEKNFEQYMREGPLAAIDAIETITGETKVNAIGYCVGGTLLAITLAWLASQRQDQVASATFFTAQVDFTYAGDLSVFVDEERIQHLEEHMKERGYLEAARMANAFNMLRPNDLIWPYVVNNYLRGKKPYPFDILYWNSDATRMPAANHSFYLRNCYLTNKLSKGDMEIAGILLDLRKVTVPVYNLATREDHIAPAKSVLYGSGYFSGPVKFVLAGSGHIAGVVNPPSKMKYQYWTGPVLSGSDLDEWLAAAEEHSGSWWPDWLEWLKAQGAQTVPARPIGGGGLEPIEDAPGSYVKVKSWSE